MTMVRDRHFLMDMLNQFGAGAGIFHGPTIKGAFNYSPNLTAEERVARTATQALARRQYQWKDFRTHLCSIKDSNRELSTPNTLIYTPMHEGVLSLIPIQWGHKLNEDYAPVILFSDIHQKLQNAHNLFISYQSAAQMSRVSNTWKKLNYKIKDEINAKIIKTFTTMTSDERDAVTKCINKGWYLKIIQVFATSNPAFIQNSGEAIDLDLYNCRKMKILSDAINAEGSYFSLSFIETIVQREPGLVQKHISSLVNTTTNRLDSAYLPTTTIKGDRFTHLQNLRIIQNNFKRIQQEIKEKEALQQPPVLAIEAPAAAEPGSDAPEIQSVVSSSVPAAPPTPAPAPSVPSAVPPSTPNNSSPPSLVPSRFVRFCKTIRKGIACIGRAISTPFRYLFLFFSRLRHTPDAK